MAHGKFQATRADLHQLFAGVGEATAGAAEGVGRPDDEGIDALAGYLFELLFCLDAPGFRNWLADAVHQRAELLAVLRFADGAERRAEKLDAELLQDAVVGKLRRQVEARLPPERGEEAVRALAGDDLAGEVHRQRLDVNAVGDVGIRHDRGGIGVDQHHLDALLAERPAGLRAGIVELGRLSDHNRTRADDHHLLNLCLLGHPSTSSVSVSLSRNPQFSRCHMPTLQGTRRPRSRATTVRSLPSRALQPAPADFG